MEPMNASDASEFLDQNENLGKVMSSLALCL